MVVGRRLVKMEFGKPEKDVVEVDGVEWLLRFELRWFATFGGGEVRVLGLAMLPAFRL